MAYNMYIRIVDNNEEYRGMERDFVRMNKPTKKDWDMFFQYQDILYFSDVSDEMLVDKHLKFYNYFKEKNKNIELIFISKEPLISNEYRQDLAFRKEEMVYKSMLR